MAVSTSSSSPAGTDRSGPSKATASSLTRSHAERTDALQADREPVLPSADEPITHRRLIDDDLRPRRIALDLLTDRADRDAEIFCLPFLCRAPSSAQQMRMAEHSARIFRKLGKHRIFFRCQVYFLAVF